MESVAPVLRRDHSNDGAAGLVAEIAIASLGTALLLCAVIASRSFLDRHFVPSFFLPRHVYETLQTFGRFVIGTLGAYFALVVRPRVGRFVAQNRSRAFQIAIAALMAFGASELALRYVHLRPTEWLSSNDEPRRQLDARLGWTWLPARTGHKTIAGRVIDYAIDPAGYRVRRVDEPVDPEKPTILFTGESVMFGEGLTWEESIPAQVSSILALQSANLAVHGYGTDQAYLRLQTELPHFRRPIAVVSLFMTDLFGRNLDQDRPHLGPGLVWLPPEQRPRIASLAKLIVPYRSDNTITCGVSMTQDVFRATDELAHAHGAILLLVVLQFGKEDDPERALRRRILDDAGIPYEWIEVDSAWRLAWDRHPNARAAHVIATAVAARLQAELRDVSREP